MKTCEKGPNDGDTGSFFDFLLFWPQCHQNFETCSNANLSVLAFQVELDSCLKEAKDAVQGMQDDPQSRTSVPVCDVYADHGRSKVNYKKIDYVLQRVRSTFSSF